MKDYKLKLRNLHASHTLGWSWNCFLKKDLKIWQVKLLRNNR